jgi:hypothetical protein
MGQMPSGYPPSMGQQYILPPSFPPIQSYPGDYFINSSPAYQYGPSFDGSFQHGTVTNPYLNYLFEDTNAFENTLYQANGPNFGYPPIQNGPTFPGMMPPPGQMVPMQA